MIEASSRVALALVVDGDGRVTCWSGAVRTEDGSRDVQAWPGLAALLAQLDDADPDVEEVRGMLRTADGDVPVIARRLDQPLEGGCILVTEKIEVDAVAAVERAHESVVDAHEALDACRADLLRLQRLSERLLAFGPPAIVVDNHRRVRGVSASAEKLLGVSASRALGRSLGSVIPQIDLGVDDSETQVVNGRSSPVRVRVHAVGTDEDDRILVFEAASDTQR
jgi:PAS domain-containing protein